MPDPLRFTTVQPLTHELGPILDALRQADFDPNWQLVVSAARPLRIPSTTEQ